MCLTGEPRRASVGAFVAVVVEDGWAWCCGKMVHDVPIKGFRWGILGSDCGAALREPKRQDALRLHSHLALPCVFAVYVFSAGQLLQDTL